MRLNIKKNLPQKEKARKFVNLYCDVWQNFFLKIDLVSWCSWLSRVLHTDEVGVSITPEINVFFFLMRTKPIFEPSTCSNRVFLRNIHSSIKCPPILTWGYSNDACLSSLLFTSPTCADVHLRLSILCLHTTISSSLNLFTKW
jgi:hypothetical protein